MKHNLFLGALFLLGVGCLLAGIRQSQLGKHDVKFYVAGQLRDEMVTTNPAYYFYETDAFGKTVLHTNYYWKVWRIFR